MNKGFNLFILGLIMFLGCLVDVKAVADEPAFENQEIFIHDWDSEEVLLYNELNYFANNNIYYEYGYIVSDFIIDNDNDLIASKFVKYDIAGEIIEEKLYENAIVIDAQLIGDKIYTFSMVEDVENEDIKAYVYVLNLDLEVIDEYYLFNGSEAFEIFNSIMDSKYYDLDVFSVDDNGNIYLLCFGYPAVIKLSKDYVEPKILNGANYVYKYFPYYGKLSNNDDYYFALVGYDKKNNYEVFSGENGCHWDSIPSLYPRGIEDAGLTCGSSAVMILHEDEEEVWVKNYDEYLAILNPEIIDNYIVAIALNFDETYEVIILDMEGNILQKIETDIQYFRLEGGDKSFMVSTLKESNDTFCYTNVEEENGLDVFGIKDVGDKAACYTINREVWYIPLTIETKTDGNGTVTAVASSRYGEDVSFTVTPKEGFVLGEVKVTDEFGNVVTFTDYHFTMPNANVVIDVTFLPKNSETADIAIVALVVIALGSGVILLKNRKRLN